MRRILVPLDGTARSAAILPDARRVAGRNGVLILLNEADMVAYWDEALPREERSAVLPSGEYLGGTADELRAQNVTVETHTTVAESKGLGIDEAATIYHADMVAVATHASGARGRPPQKSIALEAVSHSSVPVLIRRITDATESASEPQERRIMVPLDGTPEAEKALPLARDLASEWHASLWLVHVVSHRPISEYAYTATDPEADTDEVAERAAQRYLNGVAAQLDGEVHTRVLLGSPVDGLARAATRWSITDVVLARHGRSDGPRGVPGSVTNGLLHRLELPMIAVPVSAAGGKTEHTQQTDTKSSTPAEETRQPAETASTRSEENQFKHIVVALDGTEEAEAIMPAVEPIARAFDSTVTVVCALVPVEDTATGRMELAGGAETPGLLQSVYDTRDLVKSDEASYLARVKRYWTDRGIEVECREPPMRAADAIVTVAREKGADLIAMATHAQRGIRRAMRGSVADEVMRTAPCPVLLVRED